MPIGGLSARLLLHKLLRCYARRMAQTHWQEWPFGRRCESTANVCYVRPPARRSNPSSTSVELSLLPPRPASSSPPRPAPAPLFSLAGAARSPPVDQRRASLLDQRRAPLPDRRRYPPCPSCRLASSSPLRPHCSALVVAPSAPCAQYSSAQHSSNGYAPLPVRSPPPQRTSLL